MNIRNHILSCLLPAFILGCTKRMVSLTRVLVPHDSLQSLSTTLKQNDGLQENDYRKRMGIIQPILYAPPHEADTVGIHTVDHDSHHKDN